MLSAMILKKNAGIRWQNCLPEDVEQVNDTSFFVAFSNPSEFRRLYEVLYVLSDST